MRLESSRLVWGQLGGAGGQLSLTSVRTARYVRSLRLS
ncbi:conserved protein of unknown function [Ectopseudomonas oleovorans]|uniref:Uncharacterized protein n=1 Tax=Ectopseudomonas oleovorans TaxID=301 RepID=A0A653AY31_ECTOL|nr:conserved protein of unknown function [Pseudomonas oleovorans]